MLTFTLLTIIAIQLMIVIQLSQKKSDCMVQYHVVDGDHRICQEQCPDDVSRFIKKFWESRDLGECDGAVVATKGREIVGFFRFYEQGSSMFGAGTYILGPYRKQGMAKKLWYHAIKAVKPTYIDVTATSTGAIRLLNSLKQKYPNIIWAISKNL